MCVKELLSDSGEGAGGEGVSGYDSTIKNRLLDGKIAKG